MTSTLVEANAYTEKPPVAPDHGDRCGLSHRQLMRAHLYMEANLGEPLTLGDIAAAACLSRSHFARAFRASTDCSVMAYLYRLRVERAMALLREGRMSISELSAALGFAHQSHFTRVFRRLVGMNPRVFGRRYGEASAEFLKKKHGQSN